MTNDEFTTYYKKYENKIKAIARKHARRDEELYKDLIQEGAFALFKLNLTRVRVNEDAWIRQAIKYRMIDYLRKVNPEAYESLQDHIESGAQVFVDADGDTKLLRPSPTQSRTGSNPSRHEHHDTESRIIKLYEDTPGEDV